MIYKDLDIKKIRSKLGLSQDELANRLGISLRTVQNWEAGKVIPKSKHAILRELSASNENTQTIKEPIAEYGRNEVITMTREVFDQISKLTETVFSQQRTIENLSVVAKDSLRK